VNQADNTNSGSQHAQEAVKLPPRTGIKVTRDYGLRTTLVHRVEDIDESGIERRVGRTCFRGHVIISLDIKIGQSSKLNHPRIHWRARGLCVILCLFSSI
jgi:hypothetical protein